MLCPAGKAPPNREVLRSGVQGLMIEIWLNCGNTGKACPCPGIIFWKGGWAALRQHDGDDIDLETIKGWIVQSYRAVATKKLVKLYDAAHG